MRFATRRPEDSIETFRLRINTRARAEGQKPPSVDTEAGWLDAEAFAHAARAALAGQDTAGCRAALALYSGDYLPGDAYEEWALAPREELRQREDVSGLEETPLSLEDMYTALLARFHRPADGPPNGRRGQAPAGTA